MPRSTPRPDDPKNRTSEQASVTPGSVSERPVSGSKSGISENPPGVISASTVFGPSLLQGGSLRKGAPLLGIGGWAMYCFTQGWSGVAVAKGVSMYCFTQGWTVVVARVSGEVSMYCFTQGWLYLLQVTGGCLAPSACV